MGDKLAKVSTFAAIAPLDKTSAALFDRSEVMAENLGAGGLSPNQLDRVKVPAGGGTTWEIPTLDGRGEAIKELQVIIVAAQDVRAYYATAYDGGNNPPDCYSLDCKFGVGDPGGPCEACPWSQFGTGKDANGNPTNAQACSQKKMMLCIREDSTLPFVISAPPGSLGAVSKYFMRLAGANLPYYGVVTSLTLEKVKSGNGTPYSMVKPEFVRALTAEEVPGIKAYRANLLPMFRLATPSIAREED